ncbi:MAG: RNA-binding S4 domain-containing protein [Bacteroidales bacterium]|nr:RNA-binding S4 domain-containing protein [Bacteroidales bacterium]
MTASLRMDKWLWCARLFKTRTLAAEACAAGKIKLNETAVKPSRDVKLNEILTVQLPQIRKTIQVKSLVKSRVSPDMVVDVYTDLTPVELYEQLKLMKEFNYEKRDRGIGRPTKKERREIDFLKDI